MEFTNYLIHPLMLRGQQTVPNPDVVLGVMTTNHAGTGNVDLFVAGQDWIRSTFDNPIEVRDPQGNLVRTLHPYSREALEHLCQGKLTSQGLAVEKR